MAARLASYLNWAEFSDQLPGMKYKNFLALGRQGKAPKSIRVSDRGPALWLAADVAAYLEGRGIEMAVT